MKIYKSLLKITDLKLNITKRLTSLCYLLLMAVFMVSCEEEPLIQSEDPITEIQTVSDPNIEATITPEQIKVLGKQYHSTKQSESSNIVLDFEGLGNLDYINDFYNGGTSGSGYSGTNYEVEFGVAQGLIDQDAGGTGNIANEPSPSTVMGFYDANEAYMNVAAGFTTGFSFYYSSAFSVTVSVYDGLNGTGNLLGTENLPANHTNNCTGDPYGTFCNWDPISVAISGTAKSVVFSGQANYIVFDDVTFGSLTPGNIDGDGDGVLDDVDNCPLTPNPDQSDNDLDGIGDVCDEDNDNDGILDVEDNCPLTPNPDQSDIDLDGIGDLCDDDDDNDDILDVEDNCPLTPNPDQEDYDGDGMGDICDPDDDNDGILDVNDLIDTSNMETTLTIVGCDTAVSNDLFENGVTMADLIDELVSGEYKNLGQEIKSYTELLNSWVSQGKITADQKTAIYSCVKQ